MFVGSVVALAGAVGCFVAVWNQSEDWAFWSFFLDVAFLVAIFRYWTATRRSFLTVLAGWLLIIVGWYLGGSAELA